MFTKLMGMHSTSESLYKSILIIWSRISVLWMTDYGHNLFLWKPRYIFSVPFFWFGKSEQSDSVSEDFDKREIPLWSLWLVGVDFPLLSESDPLHPLTACSSSLLTPLGQTKWHYHFYWIQLSFVCLWDFTRKPFHPSCMSHPLFFLPIQTVSILQKS